MYLRSISDARRGGFTLVELLTVMAIIAVLAGLLLAISGLVQKKAGTSRAGSEIKGIETACEAYKVDNGVYPRDSAATSATDALDPRADGNSAVPAGATTATTAYMKASLFLYQQLTGDKNCDGVITAAGDGVGVKSYMEFKPERLGRAKMSDPPAVNSNPVVYLVDPFGFSYGYSTAGQDYQDEVNGVGKYTLPNPDATQRGYNPTFDIWCTVGKILTPKPGTNTDVTNQWVKNW
jgi:prepilin-type N-terminal cleavage/methylation domain-containing protein